MMDAEKCKKIALEQIEILQVALTEDCCHITSTNVRARIVNAWDKAETAEQEEWKALPLCNEARGELVARQINPCTWYNPWFCAYSKVYTDPESKAQGHHCSCELLPEMINPQQTKTEFLEWLSAQVAILEGRVDKLEEEEEVSYKSLFKFWKQQASTWMEEASRLKKRLEQIE